MSKGIIYVLSNPAMPDIVKIGKTTNINQRLSSLYSSGVPLPFKCVYAKEVDDMNFAEVKLHAGLSSTRINEKREFFWKCSQRFKRLGIFQMAESYGPGIRVCWYSVLRGGESICIQVYAEFLAGSCQQHESLTGSFGLICGPDVCWDSGIL